jgi:hypothetical protein
MPLSGRKRLCLITCSELFFSELRRPASGFTLASVQALESRVGAHATRSGGPWAVRIMTVKHDTRVLPAHLLKCQIRGSLKHTLHQLDHILFRHRELLLSIITRQ